MEKEKGEKNVFVIHEKIETNLKLLKQLFRKLKRHYIQNQYNLPKTAKSTIFKKTKGK